MRIDRDPRRKEQVLDELLRSPQLAGLGSSAVEVSEPRLRAAFDEEVERLSGGRHPLAWGTGRWRDLISAKPLFHTMVNRWFSVPDLSNPPGARLTGKDAQRALAVDLLRHHQDSMPGDFGALREIMNRVL